MDPVQPFIEAFLPLFVAINAPSVLPLLTAPTDGMQPGARRCLDVKATATAFIVAVVILLSGRIIFRTLGITADDRLLVLLAFLFAPTLIAWIGAGAAEAVGKVASLSPPLPANAPRS